MIIRFERKFGNRNDGTARKNQRMKIFVAGLYKRDYGKELEHARGKERKTDSLLSLV